MADRNVYGLDFSENGWRMVDQGSCVWVKVPGTDGRVSLQIREGQPAQILGAWAADWNAYIEPLRDADSACWTATNSVASSNHLSGTAIDLNWDSHPFQVLNAGFDAAGLATMGEMLDFYEDLVFWGNNWDSPKDAMHSQMNGGTYGSENAGRVQDFINRKIRADGFSTFRRDNNAPVPPPPPGLSRADRYAVLIIAEGQRRNITVRGIEIALATGLVESNLTIYANAKVPDSMNIPHDAVGSDGYSVGIFQQQVRDSGNGWWWGDAATCMDPTSSAGLFYDRLAKLDYNNGANSPGSYAQAVQSSAFPDRYDQRWGDATDIYNRLATTTAPPTQGDDMAAVPQDQWDRVYRELTQRLPSRSPLRHLDQTQYYPDGLVDTVAGFTLNVDGMTHVQYVQALASYGHPPTLALLREVASADGDSRYPDRQDDAKLAQAILADVTSAPVPTVVNNAAVPAAPQIVYVDRPAPLPAVVEPSSNGAAPSTGQVIGNAYDALEALRLADALPIEGRAPLAALISVLSTKNGASLS